MERHSGWQLVLPRSRIPEVLKELHGSPTGGHFCVMKTLHRARKGPKIRVAEGSCIATMLEHPSNVSLRYPGTSAKDCVW
ncbi:hypothetical protein TNCV_969021 [Trichonephila clavipes]|nr:hypothetical protein TNCV_969021 [Trichonephila clavipes]